MYYYGIKDKHTSVSSHTSGRSESVFKQDFTLSQSVSLSDDSDEEADRRQAIMFKKFDTIDPDEDLELLSGRNKHTRAKSLPPPMYIHVEPPPAERGEQDEEVNVESSLDRRPSYLRNKRGSVSPDPYVRQYMHILCMYLHTYLQILMYIQLYRYVSTYISPDPYVYMQLYNYVSTYVSPDSYVRKAHKICRYVHTYVHFDWICISKS